ncbi:MAG: hypothetical protein ACREFC_10290 [Stellaceae bacterium]
MSFVGRVFPEFRACLMGVLFCLSLGYPALAADPYATGVGQLDYRDSAPDAATRQKALNLAKIDALERYVVHLRSIGRFSPLQYRLYLDAKPQLEASIDRYLRDIVILGEIVDKPKGIYRVEIRAAVDETRFQDATSLHKSP